MKQEEAGRKGKKREEKEKNWKKHQEWGRKGKKLKEMSRNSKKWQKKRQELANPPIRQSANLLIPQSPIQWNTKKALE